MLHGVEFVEVQFHARSSSRSPKGNLTQSSQFPHHIGRILPCHYIYVIAALVGAPQFLVFGELLEKLFARHLGDDFLHMSTLLFVHSLFLFINHSSYTLSCTHWAHCCKERERSNVVWGMGLPNFTI